MRVRLIALMLLLLVLSVACGQEETAPTATAPPSTPATAVAQATSTSAPTATATATATPVPPTATATPTETPTATPTATPVVLSAPEDFGDNRNPLTGEMVEDPAVLQRRPIAVKISNSPAEYVRPQSGLGQADLVFEHVTEGAITRFTAIIYSQSPEKMGPIRSGRLIDVELPAMYDAAFAYSGSSAGVAYELFHSDFARRILRSYVPGYYRTGEDKPFEHTLYGVPEEWRQYLEENELNVPPRFNTQMAFDERPPQGGEPATHINIRYQDWGFVDWNYQEENGRWWRWADGEEHIDANTGEQLSAANVVVIFAIHQQIPGICEYFVNNECLSFSTQIQIWGQGSAQILRDGQIYDAVWKRENRQDMFTFYDGEGNVIPLQIGNTFFQVVPLHYEDPITVE